MKAINNRTGEIVEIDECSPVTYRTSDGTLAKSLISNFTFLDAKIDYYEKLKHQYAGMAMQGLLSNTRFNEESDLIGAAMTIATALVEKLKGE